MTSKRNNTNCCVFGCNSRKGKDKSVHFHRFPKEDSGIRVKVKNRFGAEEEMDKRKAWAEVLLMARPVTKGIKVCSKHFRCEDYCARGVPVLKPKLLRFAVPSVNLPEMPKKFYLDKRRLEGANSHENPNRKMHKIRDSDDITIGKERDENRSFSEDIGENIPAEDE